MTAQAGNSEREGLSICGRGARATWRVPGIHLLDLNPRSGPNQAHTRPEDTLSGNSAKAKFSTCEIS